MTGFTADVGFAGWIQLVYVCAVSVVSWSACT